MDKKEEITNSLKRMGYNPVYDEDGDVKLTYQMKSIFFFPGEEDESYVSTLLPKFFDIEEGQESMALAACNKLNRELKVIKMYLDNDFKTVSCAGEFYYLNDASLEDSISKVLGLLGVAKTFFKRAFDELKVSE